MPDTMAIFLMRWSVTAADAMIEPPWQSRMVISELLRDLDRSRAFFAESATHDYPVTQLVADAMKAGTLRQADPAFATGQLLALVKNFFFWPEFLLGEKQKSDGIMKECVAMFLSHYGKRG